MAANRLELHETLCALLGTRNVYFQPPESVKMKYPAIVYGLDGIDSTFADDDVYLSMRRYQMTIVDTNPDTPISIRAARLPACRHVRRYVADNLYHDVFVLYLVGGLVHETRMG